MKQANTPFIIPFPYESFTEYQEITRKHLVQSNAVYEENLCAARSKYNLPFKYEANKEKPYQGKFLLIHGLGDSPYTWTRIAEELSSIGYDVRAILLSGHGGDADEMKEAQSTIWIEEVTEHARLWQKEKSGALHIGGFSLGAVLAVMVAENIENISSFLFISPAFAVRNPWAFPLAKIICPVCPWVTKPINPNPIHSGGLSTNALIQFMDTLKTMKKSLSQNSTERPFFCALSGADSTIDAKKVREFLWENFTHPANNLLIYTNEKTRPKELNQHEEYAFGGDDDIAMLNQSHISVQIGQNDIFFGEKGSITTSTSQALRIKNSGQKEVFAEMNTKITANEFIHRTPFNPHLDVLLEKIRDFYSKL